MALLQPRSGERWLDVATVTGGVALRAAGAGAGVVGLDMTPQLLGGAFELDVRKRSLQHASDSLEAHYEWATTAVPPMAAFMGRLDPARHDEFRRYFLDTHARFVQPDGSVVEEREYLLVTGRRR